MSGILKASQRQAIIKFVSDNAGDDIVIAAGLRTWNNIEESKQLCDFIATYQRSVVPDVGAALAKGTAIHEAVEKAVKEAEPEKHYEAVDLGPPASKLGANGQSILTLLQVDFRVQPAGLAFICKKLKLSEAKAKPMLALLIKRNLVKVHNGGFVAAMTI